MPATAITGGQFTFTFNSVAYSAQVTGGDVIHDTPVTRIKTLTDVAYDNTDESWAANVSFLYDQEDGFYGALTTAQTSGTAGTVALVGGDAKWTGSMYVSSATMTYAADGIATVTANLQGTLTLADAP